MLLIDKNFLILPLREVHWKIQKLLDVGQNWKKTTINVRISREGYFMIIDNACSKT